MLRRSVTPLARKCKRKVVPAESPACDPKAASCRRIPTMTARPAIPQPTASPTSRAASSEPGRKAVILFARSPQGEARHKRLPGTERLFALARERVVQATANLAETQLVVVGEHSGRTRLPAGSRVLRQRGRGFGERLENAFADVRGLGFELIVAVGIDSPGLTAQHLRRAFDHLAQGRAVLGPAADGGVYLLGARGDVGSWFRDVRWQTSGVLAQLRARHPDAVLLPATLTDVDCFANLAQTLASGTDRELAALILQLLAPPAPALPARSARRTTLPVTSSISRRGPPTARAA